MTHEKNLVFSRCATKKEEKEKDKIKEKIYLFRVLMAVRSKLRQKEISDYGPLQSSDGH